MKKLAGFSAVLLAISAIACLKLNAQDRPFSIKYEMVTTSPSISERMSSLVYVKGKNSRVETEAMGKKVIMIIKEGRQGYMYYPEQNMAMSMPIPPTQHPSLDYDYSKKAGSHLVGTDTIDGKLCDVYEYEISGQKTKAWVAKDINFPLRVETMAHQGKVTTSFNNVQVNPSLGDDLFALPAGAKLIDISNMSEMMKGLGEQDEE